MPPSLADDGSKVPRRGPIERWEAAHAAAGAQAGGVRVYATSDLHADRPDNADFLRELVRYRQETRADNSDVLVVAGDVADDPEVLIDCLASLREAYGGGVVFVPGNHDLWQTGSRREGGRFEDSLDKLGYLLRECEARGVHTRTLRVPLCGGSRSLWVVPLLAWHHQSWDREPPITGLQLPPFESCMSDYRCCTWPEGIPGCDDPKSDACARLLDAFEGRNDEAVALLARERRAGDVVISCSHFLPHQCLMPTKRMLFMPELPKACGSDLLRPRIDALGGVGAHVFGHTHFAWDMDVDSVRFLSCPLAYPTERRNNMNGGGEWVPLRVWEVEPTALDGPGGAAGDGELGESVACGDGAVGAFCPRQPAFWSSFYRLNGRDPTNMTLAPWVEKRLGRRMVGSAAVSARS